MRKLLRKIILWALKENTTTENSDVAYKGTIDLQMKNYKLNDDGSISS